MYTISRHWLFPAIIAFAFVVAHDHAAAQARVLRDLIARPSAAEALAEPYGQSIVEEFTNRLSEMTDAKCLKARNITPAVLKRRAGEILANYGNKLVALQWARVSEDALAARLEEIAGSGAANDMRTLADPGRIKQLQGFYRAKNSDNLVDRITSALDHYAIIRKLYCGSINPLSSGKMELAMMAAERAVNGETAAKASFGPEPKLTRLVDLYGSLIDGYDMEIIQSNPLNSPDYEVFKGIEQQLEAMCVRAAG
jgi:hypothetical protein